MKALLFIVPLFLFSCIGGNRNPLPPDDGTAKPLIIPTWYHPADDEEIGVIEWEKIVEPIPASYRPQATNEFFPIVQGGLPECKGRTVYHAMYNFNRGRKVTDRAAQCLDTKRPYLMIDIFGVIQVVAYLVRHIRIPIVQEFLQQLHTKLVDNYNKVVEE